MLAAWKINPVTNYRGKELTWPRVLEVLEDYLDGRRKYSYDPETESCRYRLDHTAKCETACLIGSFLDDDNYDSKTLETKGITDLLNKGLYSELETEQLKTLQNLHDYLSQGISSEAAHYLDTLSVPPEYRPQLDRIRSKIVERQTK